MRLFSALILAGLTTLGLRAGDLPPLNPAPTGQTAPGKIVWGDLFTSRPEVETAFYTGLFGWTAEQIQRPHGSYTVLFNGDRPVAGIAYRKAMQGDVGRGLWINYVSVADIGAALAAAGTHGGRVVYPAKAIPQRGSQAILADNAGALLGVLSSSSGDPIDGEPAVGEWAWAHLSAPNPKKAAEFYAETLGYSNVPDQDRPGVFLLRSEGFSRASLGPLPEGSDAQPEWLGFVRVAHLDATLAKAATLGGSVLLAPRWTKADNRLAILADPNGVAIGVVELLAPSALETAKP